MIVRRTRLSQVLRPSSSEGTLWCDVGSDRAPYLPGESPENTRRGSRARRVTPNEKPNELDGLSAWSDRHGDGP